jgi:DNA-binding NtrC family response regulator
VRELKNLVHRAYILARSTSASTPCPWACRRPPGSNLNVKVGTSLGEVEQRLILATLEDCEGDKKKAAEVLGISLKTLYNRLNEYKSA